VREAIANRTFSHLDSLRYSFVERCLQLRNQALMIQRVTTYIGYRLSKTEGFIGISYDGVVVRTAHDVP
jgi:hypothetical protein